MIEIEELVGLIVKELVSDESSYDISTLESDGTYTINVDVKKEEIGKVIGKQGKIAKAIRTLIRAYAIKNNKKIFLEINEL